MASRVITALFDNLADAERARARLIEMGVGRDQVSIVAQARAARQRARRAAPP
jgi:hypothetical protein